MLTSLVILLNAISWNQCQPLPTTHNHFSLPAPLMVITCNPRIANQRRKLLIGPILKETSNMRLLVFSLILSGDIQWNPGPTVAQQDLSMRTQGNSSMIYPCGSCRKPVTWENERAICCDECDIWYHSSCLELCSSSSELFQHNSVSWLCAKCNNLNTDNFMYHSFELETSNRFSVLSNMSTIPSIDSSFSPTTFSSPRKRTLLLSSSSSPSSQSSRQEAAQLPN